ncbi:Ig-like domain-containing protein [Streptomyces sp. NPDC004542]|uniref:L,D-transpeptidase n=1 Tax=Streptomyces sp. NPDC004542 TaxID=3154281 RepID=UPI0033ACF09D
MSTSPRTRTVVSCALLMAALGAGVTACGSDGNPLADKPYDASDQISFSGLPGDGKKADPDKPLEVTAEGDGRITDVTAVDATGRYVAGELAADGSRWHSTAPLAADAHYTVRISTEDEDGAPGRRTLTFDTSKPTTTKRLEVAFGPGAGAFGVGQPITAKLNQEVKDKAQRAVVERALRVDSVPAVTGSWYWVDGKELHYRPRDYWPAHATLQVHSNLDGVRINDRLWGGGAAKPLKLTIGDRIEALTDGATHQMTVYKNGAVIRQIPITTGKPGFETRNGVKVVLEKEPFVRMRSTTVGIAEGTSDSYDLPVYYATRVTWSGEYVHAAPWSVGSQGYANVSHGCTGMSTANAEWFFDIVHPGDIVKVVNTGGHPMEPFGNGFGDWNLDWNKWLTGSALTGGTSAGVVPQQDAERLQPTAV